MKLKFLVQRGLFVILLLVMNAACKPDPVPEPSDVAVSSIKLTPTSVELAVGETVELTTVVSPANATDKTVKWSSSNRSVASVSNGKIKAIAVGNATITAQAGNVKAECSVKVISIEVTSISLNKTSLNLKAGESFELIATVSPENAKDKTVSWSSSNTDVVTVNNGKVTAVSVGSAKVIAKSGTVKAECSVTVNPIEVTSVSLNKASIELYSGETELLTATVYPENATDKDVRWETMNSGVATVNGNGEVAAVAPGSTRIYVHAGNRSAFCEVTVKSVSISKITLDKHSVTMLPGETEMLTVTIEPSNADYDEVTWKTSDASVATVASGRIIAHGVGMAEISINIDYVSDHCTVLVLPTSLSFSQANITMNVGDQRNLASCLVPSATPPDVLTWSSSAPDVVSVANGVVSALKNGKSTITVKSTNGLIAECNIFVVSNPDAGGSEGTGEVEW